MEVDWISVIACVLVAALVLGLREQAREAIDRDFAAQLFRTRVGAVHGRDLRVAHRMHTWLGRNSYEDWWYCVGPGPMWLLIVSSPTTHLPGESRWLVREISESAMRDALRGNAKALAIAFPPA